jgi:hypothetical protein
MNKGLLLFHKPMMQKPLGGAAFWVLEKALSWLFKVFLFYYLITNWLRGSQFCLWKEVGKDF